MIITKEYCFWKLNLLAPLEVLPTIPLSWYSSSTESSTPSFTQHRGHRSWWKASRIRDLHVKLFSDLPNVDQEAGVLVLEPNMAQDLSPRSNRSQGPRESEGHPLCPCRPPAQSFCQSPGSRSLMPHVSIRPILGSTKEASL